MWNRCGGARAPQRAQVAGHALSCLALVTVLPAAAQVTFPAKPVRMIVPFAPGGPTDILARGIGQRLSERWGQPVVIDNRPGAGGNIAAELVARASPDGYTLLLATAGILSVNPSLFRMSIDPQRDLTPVTVAATMTSMLVVHPSLGVRRIGEFVELARARPGGVSYGSSGHGSASHLASELLKLQAQIDLRHVPYRGAAPAVADLVGGHLQVMLIGVPVALPQVRAGRLVALGIASGNRSKLAPEVPTLAEGGLPGVEVDNWLPIVAPARMSAAGVRSLHAAIIDVLQQPAVRERLVAQGFEPVGNAPEALAAMIRDETARWSRVVREAGIKVD